MNKETVEVNREEINKALECFRIALEMQQKLSHIKPSKERIEKIEKTEKLYPPGIVETLIDLRASVFGLTHEIASRKTICKDRSSEALVEALINAEKYFSGKMVINEHLDWYGDLKLVLEQDAPLFNYEECLVRIGIKRDRDSPSLTRAEKKKILDRLRGFIESCPCACPCPCPNYLRFEPS